MNIQTDWGTTQKKTWLEANINLDSHKPQESNKNAHEKEVERQINRAMHTGSTGNVGAAINMLKPLLKERCYQASIHNNLGILYNSQQKARHGYQHFKCALRIDPNHPEALINAGNYLCITGEYIEAEKHYKSALKKRGECHKLLANYGHCLMEMNRLSEAETVLRNAILISDNLTTANFNLASVCLMQGKLDEAQVLLRQITKAAPTAGAVQRTLANCIRFTHDSPDLKSLKQAFKTSEKKSADHMHIAFALAKAYEDMEQPRQAWRYASIANGLLRKIRPYNSKIQQARFTSNLRLFNHSFCQRHIPKCCQSDQRVIFLIGLPRCGSTLVHQILSMHPDVKACGESTALGEAILRERARDISANSQTMIRIRDAYLNAHSNPDGVIVDKNLYNFYWVPLIRKIFPESIIIDIRRERYGHYWSMYKNYFSHGNEFTSSLAWIDEFVGLYKNMLNHWRQDLGIGIGEVWYEDLVRSPAETISRLLELCGLDWHDDCMNHSRSKTPVRTASVYQVRQSIYQSSAKGASLYAPLIEKGLPRINPIQDT